MKLLKQVPGEGLLRLQIETLDDLWHLRNLIAAGDLVTMDTYRTAESTGDRVRDGKQEKKRMKLGVRVESVEWHDFDDHLRVLGTIASGPQDLGKHHTHVIKDDIGTRLDLQKPGRLQQWHIDLVQDAADAAAAPQVVLLAIDDSEAQFAILRGYGVQWLGSLPAGGQGKRFDGAEAAKKAFYAEAIKTLATLRTSPDVAVVVVGPGWWREEFINQLQQHDAALAQGVLTDGTSQGGRGGIQEALRRGVIEKVARDHRIHVETERIEEVFARIAQDGLVAYGPDEVHAAVQAGAAEEVLVTDHAMREDRFDRVLREAERTRCGVHIVAGGHDAGARLEQIGGIAALLRFQV
ncbi:MAG: mRNA surveillance protein pelota [Thermoplasmatota archaeon]